MTEEKQSKLAVIANNFNQKEFETRNEEMSFEQYIEEVYKNPSLIRSAYQRVWDMIMSHGISEFKRYRKTYVHYNFFDDVDCPIFGLEDTINQLCQFIRGAAGGYGTEKRVLLLHGPVGSAKSTICRVIKRGLEKYSETQEGKWYTFKWINLPTGGDDGIYTHREDECPMHEDPIKLIPQEIRNKMLKEINKIWVEKNPNDERIYSLKCDGDLDPRCRLFMDLLLKKYNGDWHRVVNEHIVVIRKTHSEAKRMGIATFQPKDEKNQDATELTGDINYAKLPHFGTDSDPRAFNFDGEFCVGNRGVIEFIEMLKLAQEFLYDLLGASQERQIKPKKFAQVSVDEVLIGHSVHGDTPIPHEYNGVLDVLPISKLNNLNTSKLRVFSVNMDTKEVELTEVKSVFNHNFEGDWVENYQEDDCLVTTPNHSVYNTQYETFYPGDDEESQMLRADIPAKLISKKQKTDRWVNFFS